MSKFGLPSDLVEDAPAPSSFSERLAAIPPSAPRQKLDIPAIDAAAAAYGFVSREPGTAGPFEAVSHGRRRRVTPSEPTRHLAIRLTNSHYDRFVAYADANRLTYHEALIRLLDTAERGQI